MQTGPLRRGLWWGLLWKVTGAKNIFSCNIIFSFLPAITTHAICIPVRTYHSAFIWVIEPLEQLYTCAFATAAAAHKGQRLTRLDRHIETIQDLDVWPGRVRELAVNELNVALEVLLTTKQRARVTVRDRVVECHPVVQPGSTDIISYAARVIKKRPFPLRSFYG